MRGGPAMGVGLKAGTPLLKHPVVTWPSVIASL